MADVTCPGPQELAEKRRVRKESQDAAPRARVRFAVEEGDAPGDAAASPVPRSCAPAAAQRSSSSRLCPPDVQLHVRTPPPPSFPPLPLAA